MKAAHDSHKLVDYHYCYYAENVLISCPELLRTPHSSFLLTQHSKQNTPQTITSKIPQFNSL